MNIVISGATGLVGKAVVAKLCDGSHKLTALTRNPDQARTVLPQQVVCMRFSDNLSDPWASAVSNADAVINLAGESIGGQRWNPAFKSSLRTSRIDTTRTLVSAMPGSQNATAPVLISASAVGYYGDTGDLELSESSSPGSDFLADICRQWESEALKAGAQGVRVVTLRLGHVLAKGGVLHRMIYPFDNAFSPIKLGLGGPLGSGKQYMSWIHIDDLVNLVLLAIENTELNGPMNATAPNSVTNKVLTAAIASKFHKPAFFPLPAIVLKLIVGEFAECLLYSQRALPVAATNAGYRFVHSDIQSALSALL